MRPENWYGTSLKVSETLRNCPSIAELPIDRARLEILEFDDDFRRTSLLENESTAAGHENERKELYAVMASGIKSVPVNRVATAIYPPEYLHPGNEYPPDEFGRSESIGQALARFDMHGVQAVALHHEKHGGHSADVSRIQVALVRPLDQVNSAEERTRVATIGIESGFIEALRSEGWFVVRAASYTTALQALRAGAMFDAVIFSMPHEDVVEELANAMRFRRCLPHSVLIGCIGGFDRWRSTVGNEDINKLMTRHTWDPMVQKWFDHEEATTLLDLSGLPPPEFPGIVKTLVVRTKKA